MNEGNTTLGPTISLRIGDTSALGKVIARAADPGEESILKPGDEGILQIDVASYGITRCTTYAVELDSDRAAESDLFDERSEDTSTMATSCLRWTTPITRESLGFEPDEKCPVRDDESDHQQ